MDNFIRVYLADHKRTIEERNRYSDNKAYSIRTEKLDTLKFLLESKRITETDKKEALKILGLKN